GSEGVAEVELDDRRRATGAGHGQAHAAGHCPGAQLDADAVHPAGGLEGPAVQHRAGIPAYAGEQVGSDGDLPLGAELGLPPEAPSVAPAHSDTRRPSGRYPRTSPTWCENEPLHSDTARSPIPRLGNTPLSYVSTSPTPATVTNVRLIGAESTAATSSAQRACSAFTRSEAPAMLPRRRSIDALMAPRSTRTSATRRPFWNRSTGWCA